MDAWPAQLGLHVLAVALTPLVGLLLVFWGLCGDRSNGRPRCPECWYDMRGHVPGASATSGTTHGPEGVVMPLFVCPECGHDARTLRKLYQNRRRGGPITLGIIVLFLVGLPIIIGTPIDWVREDDVHLAIRTAGGTVMLHGWGGSDRNKYSNRLWPSIGPRAARVELASRPATKAGWGALARLSYLMWLDLDGSSITDADLGQLKPVLGHLRFLDLSQTRITDQGLTHLKDATRLGRLYLGGTLVTDAGIPHLGQLTGLYELDLSDTAVTGQGFQHSGDLTRLHTLDLSGTQVTDDDLVHLRGLTGLFRLELAHTRVTDAGLIHLEALPYVFPTETTGTAITARGLWELRAAQNRRQRQAIASLGR